jgi:FKBP-type peptidyl-prolyl cis-trans isomerase (trigger factor)
MEYTDEIPLYKVVTRNDERYKTLCPYGICLADSGLPPGWKEAGKQGTKQECLDLISTLSMGEAQIDEEIERLINNGRFVAVEPRIRAIKPSDAIVIEFQGRVKGKLIQGMSAKSYQVQLGKNLTFSIDFESKLIGLMAGDRISFPLKMPNDYFQTNMAGLVIDFVVMVEKILENQRFENIEQYMKENRIESLEELRQTVRDNKERWFNFISNADVNHPQYDFVCQSLIGSPGL